MRDAARIDRIMTALAGYWRRYPDWRFCQLIENIKDFSRYEDMFYVEDDEFEALMHDFFLMLDLQGRTQWG